MEKFPELRNKQVALIRSECATGHVLDEEFNLVTTSEQKTYTIFEQLADSLQYVNSKLRESNDFEFTIYNPKKEVLYFFNSFSDFEKQVGKVFSQKTK